MAGDFKASQVQTNKIIVTGSFANGTTNQLLVYNYNAQDTVIPNNGLIDASKFDTSTGIGTDVFLFVSGGIAKKNSAFSNAVSVFGGDVHISGNLTVNGSSPGGGGGGTGVNYFWSPANTFIEASGSLYLTGALRTLSLSASNGSQISGSAVFAGAGGIKVGSDTVFFVSGNTGENSSFKSVFGGTVFSSGSIQLPFGTKLQSKNTGSGWVDIAQYADATGLGFGPQVLLLGDGGFNNTGIIFAGDGRPLASITGSNQGFFSGSYKFPQGISGSLQRLSDGSPYLLAGPNITIASNSLGQIAISGSAGGSSFFRMEVVDYTSVNSTFSTSVGQVIFPANEFSGSLTLRGVIANSNTLATGSVQLFNITSGTYVHIGGPGITHLKTTGTVPTIVTSVNLYQAANFNTVNQSVYELQASSSNGIYTTFLGGFELRPSGSFTGYTYSTSSYYYTYTSGTWEDGIDRLATTASVAIAGDLGTSYFADAIGTDVFFFVSGVYGGKGGSVPGVAVFGGDVVISGTLHGGSPLKVGSPTQFFDDVSIAFEFTQGNDVAATGDHSHAQGQFTSAQGIASHAEGSTTTASGLYAHSEGGQTTASGEASHAEGISTVAAELGSHAEGYATVASGTYSHAGGIGTISSGSGQTVIGSYNLQNNNTSLFVIGDGLDDSNRNDVLRAESGNIQITGSLFVSGSGARLHQLSGMRAYPKIITSLPYTASVGDYIIAVSASAALGLGVDLPSGVDYGTVFIVKDVSGSASSDVLRITANGTQIHGLGYYDISIDYGSAQFVYFGPSIGWGVI